MSSKLRLIIFLTFVLMFLIAAPLLVLYTAGYRLDIASGRIVHTAVLNMTSVPRNANVLIDGEQEYDRTPSVIETVLPGEHEIKLEKDEYISWKQNLFFKSRETTFADVILFLDKEPVPVQHLNILASGVSPSGDKLIYLTQESSWLEMWSTEGDESSTQLLMRLSFNRSSHYTISFSPQGDYVLLVREYGSLHELVPVETNSNVPSTLSMELADVDSYWWDVEDDNLLYVKADNETLKVDIKAYTKELIITDLSVITSFEERNIILSEHNNRSVLSFLDEEIASIITYLPLGNYTFIPTPSPLIGLFDSQHNRLILIDTNNREQPILLNEMAVRWTWNKNGQQLLYTSDFDLRLYQRDQHQTHTITRLSEKIDQIAWYPKGSVVLYQAAGTTFALAIKDPQPDHLPLITDTPGQVLILDEGDVMLLMGEDGTIWQRELQK
ncbi:MAG: PEGA domain-containing protein [Parcubacteria group bacterium]|nr:PEGA domain-containing protein [Parcubacteria group bacterium]